MVGSPRQIVAVVGAGGSLGRPVSTALCEAGHEVIRLGRLDTADEEQLAVALQGAATVIHIAGSAEIKPDTQHRVQTELCQRLLCAAQPATHFVFISSIKALTDSISDVPVNDASAGALSDPYSLGKRQAEEWLLSHTPATIKTTIVRIPVVYGREQSGNIKRLADLIRRGWPVPVSATNRRSLLYADNLASVVTRLVAAPPDQNIVHVADPDPVSTDELVSYIEQAIGKKARRLRLHASWLCELPVIGPFAGRLLGSLELDCSGDYLPSELQPQISTADGIARSLAQSA